MAEIGERIAQDEMLKIHFMLYNILSEWRNLHSFF